jgi:hypothetical protein
MAFSLPIVLAAGLVVAAPASQADVLITKSEVPSFQKLWTFGLNRVAPALTVGPEVGWNAGLESLRPPGASYYRLWDKKVAWRDVNPAPGVFDWSILDRRISLVESWGGKPLMVLGLTPQWAAADPAAGDPRWGAGTASPPADINTWREYVRALVQRYGSRIGAYELWNEANLQTFWTGTPAQMAEMVNVAVQEIGNTALTIAPSVTTRLRSGADFSKAMIPSLSPATIDQLDAWNLHTYPAGDAGPTVRDACKQRVDDIIRWQKSLVQLAATNSKLIKPTWDTEVNYGLAGPGTRPGKQWSDAEGAQLIQCTYQDSYALGIPVTFWYEFTATPFPLLGVQMTPLSGGGVSATVNAFQSIASASSIPNTWIPNLGTAVEPSVTIEGYRMKGVNSNKVQVEGQTVGVEAGTIFRPWFRFPGQTSFTMGTAAVKADANGNLTWQRKTGKRISVQFRSDDQSIRSNTVVIQAR